MKIYSYKQLLVWQKAMRLVTSIYMLTEYFPREEKYILTAQIRRAAISISSNIAEGKMMRTTKDYRHFLINAFGSGAELETQLAIAKSLPFGRNCDFSHVDDLLNEIMRMLNTLIHHLTL